MKSSRTTQGPPSNRCSEATPTGWSLQGAALMLHWGLGTGFPLPGRPWATRPPPSCVSAPCDFLRRPSLSLPSAPNSPYSTLPPTSASFTALVPRPDSYNGQSPPNRMKGAGTWSFLFTAAALVPKRVLVHILDLLNSPRKRERMLTRIRSKWKGLMVAFVLFWVTFIN